MIFIVVKFSIRPDVAEQWLSRVAPFTSATRAEPGNIFFEWSRSVERPNQFVLIEAFRDRAAGEAHVRSEHFKAAMAWMPEAIAATPEIIHVEAPRRRLVDHGRAATAHRCCARLVTLASLARGNMLFLQVILFRKPWRYV